MAGWAFVGGKLCAVSLDKKGDPHFSSFFSNLGTIEVRLQVGADRKVFFFSPSWQPQELNLGPHTH